MRTLTAIFSFRSAWNGAIVFPTYLGAERNPLHITSRWLGPLPRRPGRAAYDSNAMRATLAARGAWACIKPMANSKNIPAFSTFLYRYRNLVERFFNKLKHFRAVAMR